jgi:hypothetical protein
MTELTPLREIYALIGEILVEWAEAEVLVDQTSIHIEMKVTPRLQIPTFTDMSAFRSFKERKGHLRKLVLEHGTKAELATLDRALQLIGSVSKLRHTLSHDRVKVRQRNEAGDYYMYAYRPAYRGKGANETTKSLTDLQAARNAITAGTRMLRNEVRIALTGRLTREAFAERQGPSFP